MDDPGVWLLMGKWGAPLFLIAQLIQLYRERMHIKERERLREQNKAHVRVISKAHELLPEHILTEEEVWSAAPKVREARDELARSLPPDSLKAPKVVDIVVCTCGSRPKPVTRDLAATWHYRDCPMYGKSSDFKSVKGD